MKALRKLAKWINPRPESASNSRQVLAVIDFQTHTRGGHFGPWLKWFVSEFSERFDHVMVVTPNPQTTRLLFEDVPERIRENLSFHALPSRLAKRFDLNQLKRLAPKLEDNLHAFVMWAFDLLEFKRRAAARDMPWAALTGISWHLRGHPTPSAELEKRLLELFEQDSSCRGFLQADSYIGRDIDKGIWIPDVENIALPECTTELVAQIHEFAKGHFCVGTFGLLTGYRCLDEILRLARIQPTVHFVLAGRIFENTVSDALKPYLEPGILPNVLIIPGFIDLEEELNAAIAAVDALFIDSRSYPVQSGVVCKAIHYGRCILSPKANSWTNDFIIEHDVGVLYSSMNEDLTGAFERWVENGGNDRARATSATVRDPVQVARCFDNVTKKLTGVPLEVSQ